VALTLAGLTSPVLEYYSVGEDVAFALDYLKHW